MRKSSIVCTISGDREAVAYVVDVICHAAGEKWAIAENARGQAFIMWCGDHWNEISEQDKILPRYL